MSDENGTQQQVPVNPRCGFCGQDPVIVFAQVVRLGGARTAIYACMRCRATYGVVPLEAIQLPAEDQGPKIWTPDGRVM